MRPGHTKNVAGTPSVRSTGYATTTLLRNPSSKVITARRFEPGLRGAPIEAANAASGTILNARRR
jgi:hypothetical protein